MKTSLETRRRTDSRIEEDGRKGRKIQLNPYTDTPEEEEEEEEDINGEKDVCHTLFDTKRDQKGKRGKENLRREEGVRVTYIAIRGREGKRQRKERFQEPKPMKRLRREEGKKKSILRKDIQSVLRKKQKRTTMRIAVQKELQSKVYKRVEELRTEQEKRRNRQMR